MAMTVRLPDELARRVATVAAERGVPAEQVVVEAVEAGVTATTLSFIGIGRSGRGDLSKRHKEIRKELLAERRPEKA